MDESILGDEMSNRRGSLPPDVKGTVNGYLTMTVNNIRWRGKSRGTVRVYVSWWGEKQKVLFIPQEVQNLSGEPCMCPEATYVYCVMTNIELFLAYLEDSEGLNFYVFEQGLDFPVGSATLKYLRSIVLNNPYQTSCVIIDNHRNEVADLSISFMFNHTASSHKKFYCMKNLPQSHHDIMKYSDKNKLKEKEHCKGIINSNTCSNVPQSNVVEKNKTQLFQTQEVKDNTTSTIISNENADAVSNSTISGLLQQCQNIRQEYSISTSALQMSGRFQENLASLQPRIMNYLLGKDLSKEEELVALEAIRTTSPLPEMLQLSGMCVGPFEENIIYNNKRSSKIQKGQKSFSQVHITSEKFEKQTKDSENEERRNNGTSRQPSALLLDAKKEDRTSHCSRFLRLTIQTLSLNYMGMQRVAVSSRTLASRSYSTLRKHEVPPGVVYFVEYEIPQCLTLRSDETQKTRKPWNCNIYRLCSRQKTGKCIHFYRQMIHMLACNRPRFTELLCNSSIIFKIYSRHLNQRLPCLLGEASLSLGNIVKSCLFSTLQEVSVYPYTKGNSRHVLALGTLKVKVEFGTNRNCFKIKPVAHIRTESSTSSLESDYEYEDYEKCLSKLSLKGVKFLDKYKNNVSCIKNIQGTSEVLSKSSKGKLKKGKSHQISNRNSKAGNNTMEEQILLFGLLHVSDGREFKSAGMYLISHGFWKEDVMTSDICGHTKHPCFKFHKIMPVLLSLKLLNRCYNNFMIVETWSQSGLVGIVKLPLNQFYIAYRDPAVVQQLLLSKYPIIGTDGWVDVVDPISQLHVGQLNVVLALGTEKQIQMLEVSRCLKEDFGKHQLLPPSFSVESDCIFTRSTAQFNDSTKNDPLSKFRMSKCFEHLMNSEFRDHNESSKSHWLHECENDKSEQYLYTSQSHDSECSSFKLTGNNASEKLGHNEQNVPTLPPSLSSQDSKELLGFSCCSNSPIINKTKAKESCGMYRASEVSFFNKDELCVKSDRKNQKRNDICSSSSPIVINPHSHVKSSEMSSRNRSSENDVPKNLNEEFINIFNSVQIEDGEACKSFLTDNHMIEKDVVIHEADNYLTLMGIINERVHVNSVSNFVDNCVKDGDSLHAGNCLSSQDTISNNRPENESQEAENFVNGKKSTQNEVLDQSLQNLTPIILEEIQNHIDLLPPEVNKSNDDQSLKLNDNFVMTVATENACTQTDALCPEKFFALIEVINALYVSKLDNDQLPSCYVTIHTVNNTVLSTPVIIENTEPVWNWSCEVWLPTTLFKNDKRHLILKVWHKKNKQSEHPDPIEDIVIGFVALDLRVLLFGLPCITGWFNINNWNGNCEGHIQVVLTPLENIEKYQNKWILPKLKNEVTDCGDNEDISLAFPAPVSDLNSVLEKSNKTLFQELQKTEMSNVLSAKLLNEEGTETFSLWSDNTLSKQRIVEKHTKHRNTEESSPSFYDTAMEDVPFKSNFNDISIRTRHMEGHHADKLDSAVPYPKMISSSYNDQVEPEHVHSPLCLSYFTDTLRKKLSELDEVMQQIKDRSKRRNSILDGHVIYNDIATIQENYRVHCNDSVDCHDKSDVNIAQEMTGEDNVLPLQMCSVFSRHLDSQHHTVKEKSITNQSQRNIASMSSFPSQCSDCDDDNVQRSSFIYPCSHGETVSDTNDERHKNEIESARGGRDFSDNVLSCTDHLMCEALGDMELENIFNPLLFQHIVTGDQCQRCCPKQHKIIDKSDYSLCIKHLITPHASKTLSGNVVEKSSNCAETTLKISNENNCKESASNETDITILYGHFVDHLLNKLKITGDNNDKESKRCGFAVGRVSPESCDSAKESVCENLSFSDCSGMESVDSNLNSRKRKNAVFNQFVPRTDIETMADSKQCSTRNIILKHDTKCSLRKTYELVKHPSATTVECNNEKILNVVTHHDRVKDKIVMKNIDCDSKFEKTVKAEGCNLVAVCDDTAVLDSFKGSLQDGDSGSAVLELEIKKLESDRSTKQEKAKEKFPSDSFEEYPVMLNEMEMMRLVKILNNM